MAKRGTIADYTPAKLKKFISDNADALGDITSVTAGTGLSGGGTSGAVTLNLDLADVISSDTENRLLTSDGDGSLTAETNLTYDGTTFVIGDDAKVNDDLPLYFGSNSDGYIKYREASDNFLVISGSSAGLVLSGTTIQIDGTLEGASPLKIGGELQLIGQGASSGFKLGPNGESKLFYGSDSFLHISGSSAGLALSGSDVIMRSDDVKIGRDAGASITLLTFKGSGTDGLIGWYPAGDRFTFYDDVLVSDDESIFFGSAADSYIKYREATDNYLVISGSSAGIALSGTLTTINGKLGVGVYGSDVTDGITLPNTSDQSGQIKASSFLTYSSRRYKKDIKKLQNPINVIQSLEGVSYEWKNSGEKDFGFIAEDVGQVLPGIVQWEDNGKDAAGIDYSRIVSYLVEAVKEQQIQIEKLNQQLINRSEASKKK